MRAFGWSVALGLLLGTVSAAQSVKLNGPLTRAGTSDVAPDFVFTPDGAHVVFRADLELDGVFELWVAPSDGSAPATRLSDDPGFGDVPFFALGANGRVVFLVVTDRDEPAALFSTPLDGGTAPVDLTGALVEARLQVPFELSADGSRAVFHTRVPSSSAYVELFSVPIDGSAAPVPLDPARPRPTLASSFWIAPAGGFLLLQDVYREARLQRLALDGSAARVQLAPAPLMDCYLCTFFVGAVRFTRDARHAAFVLVSFIDDGESTDELFIEPTDGTGPVVRIGNPVDDIRGFEFSADETRIVWQENSVVFSSAVDGTGVVRLTPASRASNRFELSPDGARVVLDGGTRLYSVPIAGGAPTQLAETGISPVSFAIAPDSSTVVFTGFAPSSTFRALSAVPIAGGSPRLLSGAAVAGSFGVQTFAIAPDGARVLYREDRAGHQLFELRSVPLDGSAPPVLVSAPLSGPRDVASFGISPQGDRTVYLADQPNDETFELYGAPASGGAPAVRLNDPVPSGPVVGDVLDFRALPGGKGAVYRAQQDALGVDDLYSVLADGPPRPIRLTEALGERGDVLAGFDVSPSGSHVVCSIDDFASGKRLWVVPPDGSRAPLDLATSTAFNPFPEPRLFGAREERLVFRSARFVFDTFDLMSVRLTGGPAIRLSAFVTGTRSVREFALAAGGDAVVYRADHDQTGVYELYSAPIDGTHRPVKLNPPLGASGDVSAFLVAPSGRHVVFTADKEVDERNDLYVAPVDGTRAARRLGDLAATDGVTDLRFTAEGKRLVYRTDQSFDLYSTPLQESGRSLLLTPLPAGWRVAQDFAVARAQVVFRASPSASVSAELFRAPVLGGSPPVSISGPMPNGRRVTVFAVTPDGARVVYLANQRDSAIFELFGASLAGGPPVPLDPLPAFADVSSFALAPDARSVVYRADRDVDGRIDLFAAPLDGSAPGRRISGGLVLGGGVEEDFVPLADGRALYRADQDADEEFELFLGGVFRRTFAPR